MNVCPDDPEPAGDDPNRQLEEALVDEYLTAHGHPRERLSGMAPRDAERLMAEARAAAAQRLTEIESRAHWVRGLHHR